MGGTIMSNEFDQAANRRRFLQFIAASTALTYADKLAFAETLLPKSKLPDPMVWAPLDPANLIKSPERSDQRVRLRAGDAPERAARPFRLHGVRHRRRGDAARQPRGLPQIPAAAAPPRRRQQGRHVDDILGAKYSSPIIIAPTGGHKAYQPRRRGAASPRPPRPATT